MGPKSRPISHGGGFIGFRAELVRYPEQKFSVIVLGNVENVRAGALAAKVAEIYLADVLKDPAASGPQQDTRSAAPPFVISDDELTRYSGTFYSEELEAIYRFSVSERKLQYRVGYASSTTLSSAGPDKFSSGSTTIQFTRDGQGAINGFTLGTNSIRDIKFVRAPERLLASANGKRSCRIATAFNDPAEHGGF